MQNNIDIVAGTIVERGGDHVPHRSEEQDDDENDENRDGDDEHDSKVFNTVYYIDRTGRTAGRYTKRRLWHPERSVLSPGHELRHKAPRCFPIKTRNGKELLASIAVCVSARNVKAWNEKNKQCSCFSSGQWDLAFPETFREMMALPDGGKAGQVGQGQRVVGPDIVFAPTCWFATDSGQRGLRWNQHGEAALLDSM